MDADYTATLEKRGYIMKRLWLLILASLIFNVAVPAGAALRLDPQIFRVPLEQVNSGQGVSARPWWLTINKCTEPPILKDVIVGPQSTFVPNGKETTVWVSGVLDIAEGCTLQEFVYDLHDEYGVYSSTGPIVADETGSFKIAIQIEASRRGQDKDSRLYTGTLTATGQKTGMTRASFSVKVEHDMGKGKDK